MALLIRNYDIKELIMKSNSSLAILFSLTLAVILLVGGCQDNSDNKELRLVKMQNAKATDLKPVASEQELLNYLRNGVIANSNGYPYYAWTETNDVTIDASDSGFSETNLQVAGVDESDLVKYDGNHLFIADNPDNYYSWSMLDDSTSQNASDEDYPKIRVMATNQSPAYSEEVSLYQLTSPGVNIHGLYRDVNDASDTLVAVTKTLSSYYVFDHWYDPWAWNDGRTGVHLIDASDPAALNQTFSLEIEGQLIDSRKIDDKIYLVTRFTPSIADLVYQPSTNFEKLANQYIVDSHPLNDFLPKFKINGEISAGLLKATDCYIPEDSSSDEGYATLVTVTTVDLSGNSVKSQCVSAYSDGIFASTTGVYLFASGVEQTAIHKMSFSEDSVEYLDTGYVKGNLGWRNPAFRIGEHNNVLRVLSSYNETDQNATLKHQLTLFNSPTVLGEYFQPVGIIPNEDQPALIGKPNEDIFAVRYVGNRGYAVTFEQIDPLYVFDLSHPAAPKIVGELEVPGVSHQLHPIGENFVVGIGFDFNSETQSFGGVKVELFDVSDMSNPQSVDQIIYGKGGSYSLATSDHHAFSFLSLDQNNHRLALPVQVNDIPSGGYNPNWYDWRYTGLHLLNINTGETPSLQSAGSLVTATNAQQEYPDYDRNIRSVIHGDSIYYSSIGKVWSSNWLTPDIVDGPK
jgi:hypothetical protein